MIPPALWDRLAKRSPHDVAGKAAVGVGEGGAYLLPVLNATYRIDPAARTIARVAAAGETRPGYSLSLSSVVYLLEAQDVAPAGEWVNPARLPGGHAFFRGPHTVPVAGIVDRFGGDRDAFRAAGASLSGEPETFADAACSVRLFPRVPVAVLLWTADDEFPARASMLLDRTAATHLPLDALWAGLQVVQNAFLEAGPPIPEA
jgi:hypothetical protein